MCTVTKELKQSFDWEFNAIRVIKIIKLIGSLVNASINRSQRLVTIEMTGREISLLVI